MGRYMLSSCESKNEVDELLSFFSNDVMVFHEPATIRIKNSAVEKLLLNGNNLEENRSNQ